MNGLVRIRCLTAKCQWVGVMRLADGHVDGQIPAGEWALTRCPRCGGLYACVW